jgi:hypothetical protein
MKCGTFLPKNLEQAKTIKGHNSILRLSRGFPVGYELLVAFSANSHGSYTLPSASEMPPPENAVRLYDARQSIPLQG